ncbi:MAG TPA: hypothetical protein VHD69_00735 [Candidatus Paceibacterota bacterium]|nr:hypothetical protein [Candidatus Paceibacterota bacterium]
MLFLYKKLDALSEGDPAFKAALYDMYSEIDSALNEGKFDAVDKTIADLDVSSMKSVTLIGFLTATLPARYFLPSRSELFQRIAEDFKRRAATDPKYNDPTLLSGLA